MRRKSLVVAAALWVVLNGAVAVRAQIEDHPGYFPIDQFGILSEENLTLEISLEKGMLQLVAAVMGAEEPELAELIAGLESIRVRIAPAESLDKASVRQRMSEATTWLEGRGWGTMLRVREAGEVINIYTRLSGGELQGIAVLAMEASGDAVLVNVVGSLLPEQLAGLADVLDIPQLDVVGGQQEEDEDGEDDR